jgi:hypothetical protein
MCVEVFRHAQRAGASEGKRMITACDVTEFDRTAVQRGHRANDVFKVHDARNPLGSTLWYEAYHARIVLCTHPSNVR